MTTPQPPEPINLSAEAIAEHLRWRLSNSNAEIDLPDGMVDVAFDTDRDGPVVSLSVNSWDPGTGRRGFQTFTVAVALGGAAS